MIHARAARTLKALCLTLLALAALSGCAPSEIRNAPIAPAADRADAAAVTLPETYTLRPGDELRISVFGQENLSGDYTIDAGGLLTFPLLGEIRTEGVTVPGLRAFLTERLDRDYLVNPRVSVEITSYRPIFILGEVEDPGRFDFEFGLTVRSAVALGGGFTRRARTDVMGIVRRNEQGGLTTLSATQDSAVLPGDTIEIYRRLF